MNLLFLRPHLPDPRGLLANFRADNVAFTRNSPATYFDAGGKLASRSADYLRMEYDPSTLGYLGVLYEPQRQNVVLYSKALALWSNNGSVSRTDNAIVSPDGTQNATAIVINGTYARGAYASGIAVSASTQYIMSGYLHIEAGANFAAIAPGVTAAEGGAGLASFNLTTGAVTEVGPAVQAYSLEQISDDWWFFTITFTTTSIQTTVTCVVYTRNTASLQTGTMSGWGIQIEAGSAASSLIYTDGSAVTRATDALSFNVPSGVTGLRYVFDDDSTQDVAVSAGAYTVPTNLNRSHIKRIISL